MLTKTKVCLLLTILVAIGILLIVRPGSVRKPTDIGNECQVAPCIFRMTDGGPGLRTAKGDVSLSRNISVLVKDDRTEVWVFGSGEMIEIQTLTAIEETENWNSLQFWHNQYPWFECVGSQPMSKSQFYDLLKVRESELDSSQCYRYTPPTV